MDRLLIMMKLLREIHEHHLATVTGYGFDLILANDRALLALINGNEDAVWRYTDMARCAYTRLDIPEASVLCAELTTIVVHPEFHDHAA